MAGIYIHIPFCKKACHYCDFHFSTSLKNKTALLDAINLELEQRKGTFENEMVETIYFGGGTPSILEVDEIQTLLKNIDQNYNVIAIPEITLEANPDDLTVEKIKALSQTGINRLSIGVQSFDDRELQMMNRAHNAKEVEICLSEAVKYFEHITIDLMYGIPGMTNQDWEKNVHKAVDLGIHHISSYALTVEEGTALASFIKQGKYPELDESLAASHFKILRKVLLAAGFDHYEISNFGKPNFYSKHNSAYWLGKSYLGVGPSAHSFNGAERSWNVSHNIKYIKGIESNQRNFESEILTKQDRFNEYVMTGLRTIFGVSLAKIEEDFGKTIEQQLLKSANPFIINQTLIVENGVLKTTEKGKFLADGIAAELFWV